MTLPQHFSFASDAIGLKTTGKPDLLAIVCERPMSIAGVFTQNTCPGAPVTVSREHLKKSKTARAILVNAGIANVATGKQGLKDAAECASLLAKTIGCKKEEVLVSSTGKIGDLLPMEKFRKAIPRLTTKAHTDIDQAAQAIMTTDLAQKVASAKSGKASIVGIAKGSGMIQPNMATMLAFILTDAKIAPALLQKKWKEIVGRTFNMVSVDACESTSDMGIVCASNEYSVIESDFFKKLEQVARELALKIARDGEGATCLLECTVKADTEKSATAFARAVIQSALVKTAIHGKDPNWGRILQALGGTHLPLPLATLTVTLDGETVFRKGEPVSYKRERMFLGGTVRIGVTLGKAKISATAWGCDLSNEYITINALYHT